MSDTGLMNEQRYSRAGSKLAAQEPYYLSLNDVMQQDEHDFLLSSLNPFSHAAPATQRDSSHQATLLDIFIRDSAGTVCGGVLAEIVCNCLDIQCLWIDEVLRGRGYGRKLMFTVEAEAQRRTCRYAQVSTFSFESQQFYTKLGYRVVSRLGEFLPGGVLFGLRKDFIRC